MHTQIMKDIKHHIESAAILASFLSLGMIVLSLVGLLVLIMENR